MSRGTLHKKNTDFVEQLNFLHNTENCVVKVFELNFTLSFRMVFEQTYTCVL